MAGSKSLNEFATPSTSSICNEVILEEGPSPGGISDATGVRFFVESVQAVYTFNHSHDSAFWMEANEIEDFSVKTFTHI